jgi:hypothetical protein
MATIKKPHPSTSEAEWREKPGERIKHLSDLILGAAVLPIIKV